MAKNHKLAAVSSIALSLTFVLLPAVSLAYSLGDPLVPACSGTPCTWGWQELMTLVNNLVTFALLYLTVPIAAVMFAYSGFLMVTGGEEIASAKTKAKNIFLNTVIGLVLALAAWLIIKLILETLGWEGEWIGF